ncbi:MAG: type II toxin-antitoxin system Phd/YefM family antitoxin [Alphaproteobacteria bacterium]|nr:type II toxin-antitoxin system Phd/YefM family antitoxin [Rhodospirillales bacterium]MYE00357.1 type II toxin-antitoxin system Phd/YefM family antitoxin [Alphaproteobacteria bacterium]
MAKAWQAQEARAHFSAFLEASVKEGPQIVTRRGVETAVLLPIEQWRELQKPEKPSLKEALLAPKPRTEMLTPPRSRSRHRPSESF